jgi:hypothetical protein
MKHEAGGADPWGAGAEHESEAPQPESNATDTSIRDTLYQNIYGLTGTSESRFEHHETHLHAENQVGRNEGPDSIYRIDMWRR